MAQGVSNLTDEEISDDVSISSSRLWLLSTFLRHEPVLIAMTDGISKDSVVGPSRDLRNAGVRILALGLGKRFRRTQLIQTKTTTSEDIYSVRLTSETSRVL
ncbi:hypothetical protein P5673_000267 [Acropora cervicornis]|uniref:VWFA domain-containing protein n=1 Tax=Acropora cervicornis TaxID=6130 RepID=A0AAD9R6U0_ACRCE|nr:hypothetical protein P5673_000267 [Acropora cervicornis]